MSKLAIVLLFCGIHVLNAATCNNPLKSNFNFTGPANSANVTGLTVCKSLQNKESCCDLSTFNSIQTKTNSLAQTLRESVSARDIELTNIRLKVIPGLSSSLNRINTVMNKSSNGTGNFTFNNLLANVNASVNASMASSLDTTLKGVQNIANNLPLLKDNFMSYQKNRTTCVLQMLKLQAAAWCLACDPDYSTKGVDANGNITFSASMKTKLQNACYNYFAGTEQQSHLLDLRDEQSQVEGMAGVMEKLQNGDSTGTTAMMTVSQGIANKTVPTDKHKKPARKPDNCTQSNCTFIWDTVFKGGKVDTDMLGNGGVFEENLSTSRLLEQDFGGRVLQTSEWTADDDEAGVTVSFEDDPGNANSMTASAGLLKGTLISFTVLFLTLLF